MTDVRDGSDPPEELSLTLRHRENAAMRNL
jgi:hypothetical protein